MCVRQSYDIGNCKTFWSTLTWCLFANAGKPTPHVHYARCGEQFHHHTFVGLLADVLSGLFLVAAFGVKKVWEWNPQMMAEGAMNLFYIFAFNHCWNWSDLWWRNWSRSLDREVATTIRNFGKQQEREDGRCEDGTWKKNWTKSESFELLPKWIQNYPLKLQS